MSKDNLLLWPTPPPPPGNCSMSQKQLIMMKTAPESTDTVFSAFALLQIMKEAVEATLLEVHQVKVMCEEMGGLFQKRPDTRCTSIPNKPGWCWIRTKMGKEDDFMVAEWGTCSRVRVHATLVKMRTRTGCLGHRMPHQPTHPGSNGEGWRAGSNSRGPAWGPQGLLGTSDAGQG